MSHRDFCGFATCTYRMAKDLCQLCVCVCLKHKQIQTAEGRELESKVCFDNKKSQQMLFWQRVGTQQRGCDSEQQQESPHYAFQLNFCESQAQRVKREVLFSLFFFSFTRLLEGTETIWQLATRVPMSNNRGHCQTEKAGGRLQSRAACGQMGNLHQPFTRPH